jgi:hypothetical protein
MAAVIDDVGIGGEHPVGEPIVPHELPDVLDRVELCALPRCSSQAGSNPAQPLSLRLEAPRTDQEVTNGLKHPRKRPLVEGSEPRGPQHTRTPSRPRNVVVGADPPTQRGRPPPAGKRARRAPVDPTGVGGGGTRGEDWNATREVCPGVGGVAAGPTTATPRGAEPAGTDGG